jgi:hypothetical protein
MRKISSTRGSTRSIVHVSIEVTYTSAFLRCFAMLLRFCGAWKLLFMSTVHVVFLKYSIFRNVKPLGSCRLSSSSSSFSHLRMVNLVGGMLVCISKCPVIFKIQQSVNLKNQFCLLPRYTNMRTLRLSHVRPIPRS